MKIVGVFHIFSIFDIVRVLCIFMNCYYFRDCMDFEDCIDFKDCKCFVYLYYFLDFDADPQSNETLPNFSPGACFFTSDRLFLTRVGHVRVWVPFNTKWATPSVK